MMDVLAMTIRVRLKIFKDSSRSLLEDESKCFFVDASHEMLKEALPTILNRDALGIDI